MSHAVSLGGRAYSCARKWTKKTCCSTWLECSNKVGTNRSISAPAFKVWVMCNVANMHTTACANVKLHSDPKKVISSRRCLHGVIAQEAKFSYFAQHHKGCVLGNHYLPYERYQWLRNCRNALAISSSLWLRLAVPSYTVRSLSRGYAQVTV